MKSNTSELLALITKKAPWLLGEDKTFFPEDVYGDARQILGRITDFNLTIITDQDRVFKQYLILQIVGNKVIIDTPFEWDTSVSSFYVFFKNKNGKLNFFQVEGASSDHEKISAAIPGKISVLQKRRYKRLLTPLGSKIIFRNNNRLLESAFIHDISEGGMLLWTGNPKIRYPVNSTIQEIFILLPTKSLTNETNDLHRVLPYIFKGKIVHTRFEQSSSISKYGVSFIHENVLLYKRFNSLIANLKKQSGNKTFSENAMKFACSPKHGYSVM